jgi:GT2 family glycosyltransferase
VRAVPKVAVIVINYNGVRWLSRCLSSVATTTYRNYQVYLVDNASVDGSVEFVRKNYPSVKIIENSMNLGLPEAYNRAIDLVDAEYAVMLNNDTEVLEPRWLDYLLQAANKNQKVAAVATKMVSTKDHKVLESVGGMGIPYWRGFVDAGREEHDKSQYRDDFEPFAFCGGAALLRKTAFNDAEGFDGKMFLYLEDSDLSWRFRLRGWKVAYAPEARIAHDLGGSTGGREVTPTRLYYCHRNLLRAIVKNCGRSLAWALRNYLFFSLLITSGFFIYDRKRAVVVLKALAWNVCNLGSTYASRLRVQSRRTVEDREILQSMYPRLTRKQPTDYRSFRRFFNLLFEYADRPLFLSYTEKGV